MDDMRIKKQDFLPRGREIDENLKPVQEDFLCPEMKMATMMMVLSNMTSLLAKVLIFLRRFCAPPKCLSIFMVTVSLQN
jgi:hypothetical protein